MDKIKLCVLGINVQKVLEGSVLTVVFIVENLDLISIYLFLLPALCSLCLSLLLFYPFSSL